MICGRGDGGGGGAYPVGKHPPVQLSQKSMGETLAGFTEPLN